MRLPYTDFVHTTSSSTGQVCEITRYRITNQNPQTPVKVATMTTTIVMLSSFAANSANIPLFRLLTVECIKNYRSVSYYRRQF